MLKTNKDSESGRTRSNLSLFVLGFVVLVFLVMCTSPNYAQASAPWTWIQNSCHDVEPETLDCLFENQCDDFHGSIFRLKALLNVFNILEQRCTLTKDLHRKELYLPLVNRLAEVFNDHPEYGFAPVLSEVCGGIQNRTYMEMRMDPEEMALEIDGEDDITATIIRHHCVGGSRDYCGCNDDWDCDGGSCTEETLSGDLYWGSANDEIAVVNDGHVRAISDGTTQIIAEYQSKNPDQGISSIDPGHTDLTVGSACNEEAFINVVPVWNCMASGESRQLSATVMVFDPDLGDYVPSDCHGTDIVWGLYGIGDCTPSIGNITCDTGVVTMYDNYEQCGVYPYLREKPWIWGRGVANIYPGCIESYSVWPPCTESLTCSQRTPENGWHFWDDLYCQ